VCHLVFDQSPDLALVRDCGRRRIFCFPPPNHSLARLGVLPEFPLFFFFFPPCWMIILRSERSKWRQLVLFYGKRLFFWAGKNSSLGSVVPASPPSFLTSDEDLCSGSIPLCITHRLCKSRYFFIRRGVSFHGSPSPGFSLSPAPSSSHLCPV